jgi:hypothetical protein
MKLEKLSVSFFSFMYLSYDFAWEVIEYVQGPRNFNIIILWMQDQSENHVLYVENKHKAGKRIEQQLTISYIFGNQVKTSRVITIRTSASENV